MEKKQLIIDYIEYDLMAEMRKDEWELMISAMDAAKNAWAPYSNFCVGAAAKLADGTVVTGCNQENVAYPSGMCAERVALFAAAAAHPDVPVEALAVVGKDSSGFVEASPCGACRQVLAEMEKRYGNRIKVFCYLDEGRIRVTDGVESLLPFTFKADL